MAKYIRKRLRAKLHAILTGGGLSALIWSLVFLPVNTSLAATSRDFASVPLVSQINVKPNILIILDNSNSMDDDVDGNAVGSQAPNSRSEIARRAMRTVIADNQTTMRFGLMTYDQRNVYTTWFSPAYYDVSYCSGCAGDNPPRTQEAPVNPDDDTAGKLYYYTGWSGGSYGPNTTEYCYYHSGTSYIDPTCGGGLYPCTIYPFTCCTEKRVGPLTNTEKTPPDQDDLSLQQNYGYSGQCSSSWTWRGVEGTLANLEEGAPLSPWGQEMVVGVPVPAWSSNVTPGMGRLQADIADITATQKTLLDAKLATQQVDAAITDDAPTLPIRNAGETPIPGTLQSAYDYFKGQTVNTAPGVVATNPITAPCQKNYVILMTDGLPTTMPDGQKGTTQQLLDAAVAQVSAAFNGLANSAFPDGSDGNGKGFEVKTFVVGFAMGGSAANVLNQLAAAGGTGAAYDANDEEALNNALASIFQRITQDASSGTSAAVNTNSRSGEGGAFPAMFYPELQDTAGRTIHWAGDLTALFVDKYGRLREDSNGNHVLDDTGDDADKIVIYQRDAVGLAMPVGSLTEKMTLTMPNASALTGKYFFINAATGRRYYVCFNVNQAAVADSAINQPGQPYRQRMEVTLAATDSAMAAARKTARVLTNSMIFKAKAANGQLTIETVLPGKVEDMTAGNSGISFVINRQGDEPSSGNPTLGDKTDIKYLWSASDWLASVSDADIVVQRPYDSTEKKRHIITFVDGNQNGIPGNSAATPAFALPADGTGALSDQDIVFDSASPKLFPLIPVTGDTSGPITGIPPAQGQQYMKEEIKRVINFIRGQDQGATSVGGVALPAFRARQIEYKGSLRTWRLGDIIHSNPLVVDRPNRGYQLIYRDSGYARFMAKYANRRTVIYVGGNDGMLHAFNGGFYENRYPADLASTGKPVMQYLRQPVKQPVEWQSNGKAAIDTANFKDYDLGAELWAYVPYNLLGHLHWLTEAAGDANSQVNHVYYVDLEPVSYDVQMFPDDNDHPGGWGTILVGGMGFGGGRIDSCVKRDWSGNNPGACAETRAMSSAYFIFDITNPEKEPKLLIEFALPRQGYSTNIPTLAYFKDKNNPSINQTFLVFGSGPASATGQADSAALLTANSGQQARLFYLRLPSLGQSLSSSASWGVPGGTLEQCRTNSSRECSLQVIGGNPAYVSDMAATDTNLDYKIDVLYYGTVVSPTDGSTSLSGALRRIVTNASKYPANPSYGLSPSNWNTDSVLIDLATAGLKQPISAAANTAFDDKGNLFVYLGTGRYLAVNDQFNNDQQAFYGIKEPRDSNGQFTWGTVNYADLYDSTEVRINLADENGVEVTGGTGTNTSWRSFLADMNNRPGWTRKLRTPAQLDAEGITGTAERAVNQPAVTKQLFLATTFVPTGDACDNLGRGYLYALYYRSGTAAMAQNGPMTYFYDLGGGLPARLSVNNGGIVRIANSTGTINTIVLGDGPLGGEGKAHRLNWQEISE